MFSEYSVALVVLDSRSQPSQQEIPRVLLLKLLCGVSGTFNVRCSFFKIKHFTQNVLDKIIYVYAIF